MFLCCCAFLLVSVAGYCCVCALSLFVVGRCCVLLVPFDVSCVYYVIVVVYCCGLDCLCRSFVSWFACLLRLRFAIVVVPWLLCVLVIVEMGSRCSMLLLCVVARCVLVFYFVVVIVVLAFFFGGGCLCILLFGVVG